MELVWSLLSLLGLAETAIVFLHRRFGLLVRHSSQVSCEAAHFFASKVIAPPVIAFLIAKAGGHIQTRNPIDQALAVSEFQKLIQQTPFNPQRRRAWFLHVSKRRTPPCWLSFGFGTASSSCDLLVPLDRVLASVIIDPKLPIAAYLHLVDGLKRGIFEVRQKVAFKRAFKLCPARQGLVGQHVLLK